MTTVANGIFINSDYVPGEDARVTTLSVCHRDLSVPKFLRIGEPYSLSTLAAGFRKLADELGMKDAPQ